MEKKKRVEKNTVSRYYLVSTAFLSVILVVFLVLFGLSYVKTNAYEGGYSFAQEKILGEIVSNVDEKGFIKLENGAQELVLVDSRVVKKAQDDVILQIMGEIKENGFVKLYDNNSEMILIEYKSIDIEVDGNVDENNSEGK